MLRMKTLWAVLLISLATGCGQPADSATVITVTPSMAATDSTIASSSEVDERTQRVENGLISIPAEMVDSTGMGLLASLSAWSITMCRVSVSRS